MLVKVCGMRDPQNIEAIENMGANWMGFIFYTKSPRFVDTKPLYLPTKAKRVGVFVNEATDTIRYISEQYQLDIVQLHGSETPDECAELQEAELTVMKALQVKDKFPTALSKSYQQACRYLLFDTQTKGYGGSGNKFDWHILADYHGDTPFLLSGGISADDAQSILKINHPQLVGVDINSRFETQPGIKNVALVQQFINQIRQ